MNAGTVLRHGWMDLTSAAAFLAIWLLRERFEPATLEAWLLWPVVFEMLLVFTLALAGFGAGIARGKWRNAWFLGAAIAYLAVAWLLSRRVEWIWLAAAWLLIARAWPPSRTHWLDPAHRRWLFSDGLPWSAAVWVCAIVAYLLGLALLPGDCTIEADGERHCTSPAWLFPLVWTSYFVVEALVRARLTAARLESLPP